jgi:hypothetical protein
LLHQVSVSSTELILEKDRRYTDTIRPEKKKKNAEPEVVERQAVDEGMLLLHRLNR